MTDENNADHSPTVLQSILTWAQDKSCWQQDALRRIVISGTPNDDDVSELLALCKKEHGAPDIELDAIPLAEAHLPENPGAGKSINLSAMENLQGVNRLANDQSLEFETKGITVIYGQNGTGKSGYTRVLKKACRARHASEIIADIHSTSHTGNATAVLKLEKPDGSLLKIDWEDNAPSAGELSAITVFDKESASVHLRSENEVWFRPFGLDVPEEFAGVLQSIKDKLNVEKRQLDGQRNAVFDSPIWSSRSSLGKALNSLTHEADINDLKPARPFSDEDEARLTKLKADLANTPEAVAEEQRKRARKIDQLKDRLVTIDSLCDKKAIDSLFATRDAATSAREAATLAANEAFGTLELEEVGSKVWSELWSSARKYSNLAKEGGVEFPPAVGDKCVLCHQTIDGEAASRMGGFEDFIKADTETAASAAEKKLDDALVKLSDIRVAISPFGEALAALEDEDKAVARQVKRYLASCRIRRCQAIMQIEGGEPQSIIEPVKAPISEVEAASNSIKSYANTLSSPANTTARDKLLDELAELEDLKQAEELIKIAESEIERLQSLHLVKKCLKDTSTTAITNLGNKLADDKITPTMRDQFHSEIIDLVNGRIRVEIHRTGGKFGSPRYGIKFIRDASVAVGEILSEGEQTCVALAAYLTELANSDHSSALVFDDPVSSLDHRWRHNVARRLIKEADQRQIIVFTHDLIFVNDLDEMAKQNSIPVKLAHLTRDTQGFGIVNDKLPWRASSVKDRVDKLEKAARAAKLLFESGDEEGYRREAHRIYDELRAAWERGLEDIVFAGVVMRHRDYIKTANLKKVVALEQADVVTFENEFKNCCDYVDAHDPSRGRDAEPPAPDTILADIQKLLDWTKALQAKHKALA